MGLHILNRQRKVKVPMDEIRRRLHAIYNVSPARGQEVTVVLLSDAGIRRLNAQFTGTDRPTDCLSFYYDDTPGPEDSAYLGDIAISTETALSQSGATAPDDEAFLAEIDRLFAHSLLHLLGYDHRTPAQEHEMRSKEDELLQARRINS